MVEKTVNEAMLIIAGELAKKHGYILASEYTIWAKHDSFWGNQMIGFKKPDHKIESVKFIIPKWEDDADAKKNGVPRINIDMYWGNPRISIKFPDYNFCCLAYDANTSSFNESQAWGEKGLEYAIEIKKQIDELIKPQ